MGCHIIPKMNDIKSVQNGVLYSTQNDHTVQFGLKYDTQFGRGVQKGCL